MQSKSVIITLIKSYTNQDDANYQIFVSGRMQLKLKGKNIKTTIIIVRTFVESLKDLNETDNLNKCLKNLACVQKLH